MLRGRMARWETPGKETHLGSGEEISVSSEKPGNLEVGGASRDPTGLGALEEGLISS